MKDWADISYFAVTDKGGRDHNEDDYGHAFSDGTVTFVVADGVGGQTGGALASKTVVEMIRKDARSLSREEMLKGYQDIEQEIIHLQQNNPEYKNMGSTVAELRIDLSRQMATWGHFGDSRVYWLRSNEIKVVTRDHSVVQSLVTAGIITQHDALSHPRKNVLLGAFGVADGAVPDVLETPIHLATGDAFLLCTDGLWSSVSDLDILETLKIASSVEEWIKKLQSLVQVTSLNDRDNYTAIGVWVTASTDRTIG